MNVKKIVIGVVMSAALVFLVGCKEEAIGKIVGFIQYGVDEPTIERFQEAEIVGVNEGNIDCINAELEGLTYVDISGVNVLEVGDKIQDAVTNILQEGICGPDFDALDQCLDQCYADIQEDQLINVDTGILIEVCEEACFAEFGIGVRDQLR